jgi:phage terminase small subunit
MGLRMANGLIRGGVNRGMPRGKQSRLQVLREAVGDPRRLLFCEYYVALGKRRKGAQAARMAGYSDTAEASKVRAHDLLQNDHVREYINFLTEGAFVAAAPELAQNLLKLAFEAKDEAVQLKATNNALDRGGQQIVEKSKVEIDVEGHVDHTITARESARQISKLLNYNIELSEDEFAEIGNDQGQS